MKYTVDRTENGFAVCEDENLDIINISLECLPKGVKEGSVLLFDGEKYTLLIKEEQERRNRILSLQDDIFSN